VTLTRRNGTRDTANDHRRERSLWATGRLRVPPITSDPALVRPGDAPGIRGDNRLLRELTGWSPTLSFDRTLADILAELRMLG
jgi:nucleoside-diphosphate-sugar epimerase